MSLFKIPFFGRTSGKEPIVAKENEGAPASTGEIDYEKLATAVAGKVGQRLDKIESAQASLVAKLEESEKAAKVAAEATTKKDTNDNAPKALTMDDLNKALDARDQRQQQSASRDSFISQRLAKLPDAYKRQLGNDPTKWDAEATAIQASFEKDFVAQGGKLENKGGIVNDGGKAANQQPVDYSKRDGAELLTEAFANETAKPKPAEGESAK